MSDFSFRAKIFGTWYSEKLTQIPNYNSNFMNWVDCVLDKGQIILKITNPDFLVHIGHVEVPVLYSGGGPGHYPLITGDLNIFADRLEIHQDQATTNTIIKYQFLTKDSIKVQIFGQALTFHREA